MTIEGLRKLASDEQVGSTEHRPTGQKRWLMTHNEWTKMAGAFTTLAGAAHKIKLKNININKYTNGLFLEFSIERFHVTNPDLRELKSQKETVAKEGMIRY